MLSSWKEIAHFFGKGVRTVQRWEKTLNLPIRRPPGAPSNVVLARTSDLEAWMHRGLGKDAVQESVGEQDPSELMTELETEVNALIQRTGGNTLVSISAAGASVPKRLQVIIDAVRATDTTANKERHPLRKVA